MAYKVTLLSPIFNELKALVAFLFVFQPTKVQPSLVAVGVKSILSPSFTSSLVLVELSPPLVL